MNSTANMIIGVGFSLLAVAILFLSLLEGSMVSGCVGAVFMIVLSWVFCRRAEILMIEEFENSRAFKGDFN